MVRPEHDDGVVGMLTLVERIEDTTELSIGKTDAGEIGLDRLFRLPAVPNRLEILSSRSSKLTAGCWHIAEIVALDRRENYLVDGIQVKEPLRRIPGQMRAKDAAGEKKRVVHLTRQKTHGVVGTQLVIVILLGNGQAPPVVFVSQSRDSTVWKALRIRCCCGPRVVGFHASKPRIVAKDEPQEIVPLIRRVVASRMVKNLSSSDGTIAMVSEMLWQGHHIRKIWIPPMSVVIQAGGGRSQSRHDGRTGRSAFRRRAMGVGEQNAATGQAVDIGRVNRSLIAAQTVDPVLHVIDREKQDIRRLLPEGGGGPKHRQQNTLKEAFHCAGVAPFHPARSCWLNFGIRSA